MKPKKQLVIITGMSGAGKSIALATLEDMLFDAIDNMPLSMLKELVAQDKLSGSKFAVVIDVRNREFSVEKLTSSLDSLRKIKNLEVKLVYLDCDDEILQRRYNETRRKHPVSIDNPVIDGISLERSMVSGLKEISDLIIDTSTLKTNELKQIIKANFSNEADEVMSTLVMSFSYKQGIPREADMVFDVRFLKNPFYEEGLKELTGKSNKIKHFFKDDKETQDFCKNLNKFLLPLIPLYKKEGKTYLTIAIGCTGGQHRSVYVAEKLFKFLVQKEQKVEIKHRDIK